MADDVDGELLRFDNRINLFRRSGEFSVWKIYLKIKGVQRKVVTNFQRDANTNWYMEDAGDDGNSYIERAWLNYKRHCPSRECHTHTRSASADSLSMPFNLREREREQKIKGTRRVTMATTGYAVLGSRGVNLLEVTSSPSPPSLFHSVIRLWNNQRLLVCVWPTCQNKWKFLPGRDRLDKGFFFPTSFGNGVPLRRLKIDVFLPTLINRPMIYYFLGGEHTHSPSACYNSPC